ASQAWEDIAGHRGTVQTNGTVDIDAMVASMNAIMDNALPNRAGDPELAGGANVSFGYMGMLGRVTLNGTQAAMDDLHEWTSDTMQIGYGPYTQEGQGGHIGFSADGFWFQHNNASTTPNRHQTYAIGYFGDWAGDFAQIGYFLRGTTVAFPQAWWDRLFTCALNLKTLLYRDHMPHILLGREGTKPPGEPDLQGGRVASLLSSVLAYADGHADAGLSADIQAFQAVATADQAHATGVKVSPQHGMMSWTGANHHVLVKTGSSRTNAADPGDGYPSKRKDQKGAYVFQSGDDYINMRPVLYQHVPGALATDYPKEDITEGMGVQRRHVSFEDPREGGVKLSDTLALSAAYMHWTEGETARGAVMRAVLGNKMLHLWQGIIQSGTVQHDVKLTLENREWSGGAITYDVGTGQQTESAAFAPKSWTVNAPVWFHYRGMGYIILPQGDQTIELFGENRADDYSVYDANSSEAVNPLIWQLMINLGPDPGGASAAYVLFPAATPAEVATAATNIGITIQANSEGIMVVRDDNAGNRVAAFFEPGAAAGLSSDQRVLLAISGTNATASSLDQSADQATIQINGNDYPVPFPWGNFAGMDTPFSL
ncbi:MAG: polysaccharide lyase family 8 super-sandwich domain-containing protein, partial [Bacteroidota bacterium]